MPKPKFLILIAVLGIPAMLLGTYFYMRQNHSFSGEYASAPLRFQLIHYDAHYSGMTAIYHLHRPIGWLDEKITGVETELRLYVFDGDRSNYMREAYN